VSFLLDPPALVLSGALVERRLPEGRAKQALEIGTDLLFVGTSLALYLERPEVAPLWRLVRAPSGRDWMVNSGILRIETERIGWRGHLLAAALFACYPLWFRLGRRLAWRAAAQPERARAAGSPPR
jgi:hypothetical protein